MGTPAGQGSHCVEASLAKRPEWQGSQRSADEDDEAAVAAGAVPAGHVTHCKSLACFSLGRLNCVCFRISCTLCSLR